LSIPDLILCYVSQALTATIEKDWLRTYAALKNKDPKIYEKDVRFYHSDG
jgi:hypothetical protein